MAKFDVGDRVKSKYRTGTVIKPSDADLSNPHFEDDICVRWDGWGRVDWSGESFLQLVKENECPTPHTPPS